MEDMEKDESSYYPSIRIENILMNEASEAQSRIVPHIGISQNLTFGPAQPTTSNQIVQPYYFRQVGRIQPRPFYYEAVHVLPSANTNIGSMLVFSKYISLWEDTIRRGKAIQ